MRKFGENESEFKDEADEEELDDGSLNSRNEEAEQFEE